MGNDHSSQKLTPREMVRAHAYPVLAAVSTISLVVIALSLVPIGKQASQVNQCLKVAMDQIPVTTGNENSRLIKAIAECD